MSDRPPSRIEVAWQEFKNKFGKEYDAFTHRPSFVAGWVAAADEYRDNDQQEDTMDSKTTYAITTSRTMRVPGVTVTAGQLRTLLDSMSDDATVTVHVDYPEPPGGQGQITFTAAEDQP